MPEANSTILVVDDDPDVRASVGRLCLARYGIGAGTFRRTGKNIAIDPGIKSLNCGVSSGCAARPPAHPPGEVRLCPRILGRPVGRG
jgi:hypothetical protein